MGLNNHRKANDICMLSSQALKRVSEKELFNKIVMAGLLMMGLAAWIAHSLIQLKV